VHGPVPSTTSWDASRLDGSRPTLSSACSPAVPSPPARWATRCGIAGTRPCPAIESCARAANRRSRVTVSACGGRESGSSALASTWRDTSGGRA